MTAGNLTINCTKGSALSVDLLVKNPDQNVSDLTYWSSRMHVRRTVASADTVIELTTSNGRLSHNNRTGTITISLSSEETGSIAADTYVYDLELVSTGARAAVLRLVKGNFIVGS